MHCWHSSSVSLPSFLRWEGASGVVDFKVPEELEGLLFLLLELLPLLSFSFNLPLESEELAELLELDAEGAEEFLVWREISDLRSQYLASMVCARVESIKGVGLSNVGDFIFDVVGETAVEDVAECAIAIAVDLFHEAIELYNIHIYFLSFLHGQVVQLVLCVSDWVMWAGIGLQFGNELMVTVHPDGMGIGVGDIE